MSDIIAPTVGPAAHGSAVLATLDRLSREADERRANEDWMRTAPPVQSGPLTPNLAQECGLTISKARYHLTRLWKAGLIERHKAYAGCMCRWYVKQNDEMRDAKGEAKL